MKMIRVGKVEATCEGLDALRPFQFSLLDLFCLIGFLKGCCMGGHSYLNKLGITLSFDPLNFIR